MHLARGIALTAAGALGGLAAAAAFVKRAVPSRGDEDSDDVGLVAIFEGGDFRSRASAFRGGSLLAWYGGLQVDLSEATLAPEVHLSAQALFGGIAIRVPPGCRIESNARVLAGGVAVPRSEPEGEVVSKITVDALAIFGGVAVGARRTATD